MYTFKSIILKYTSKGEKSGWTYVDIPRDIITKLKLKDKRGFRIKGVMDDVKFEKMITYPVGDGNFIIAINGPLRKKLGKDEGAMISIKFELDLSRPLESKELIGSLKEEPEAWAQFNSLLPSHKNYFHRYILEAKGADTRAGRIVSVINAMYKKQNYGEMIRSMKKG